MRYDPNAEDDEPLDFDSLDDEYDTDEDEDDDEGDEEEDEDDEDEDSFWDRLD